MLDDLGENALVQIGPMRMTVPKSELRRRAGRLAAAASGARGGR